MNFKIILLIEVNTGKGFRYVNNISLNYFGTKANTILSLQSAFEKRQ